jgi:predicted metal-dependent hydrolase
MDLRKIKKIAYMLAIDFDLPLRSVEILSNEYEHMGECDDAKNIKIRTHYWKRNRKLSEACILDTICHELAHLQHFDHSHDFRNLQKLLKWHLKKCYDGESFKL